MINYRDYQPKTTSRIRETIEWSTTYNYNATDTEHPRILLIGDSIVNAYHGVVRNNLAPDIITAYWASSKCVTDRDYFRELDFLLSSSDFTAVSFNNGLHSLTTDLGEWEEAYRAAVKFITAKLPSAKVFITLTTPHGYDKENSTVIRLNEITADTARENGLPVIDLYSAMMEFGRDHMSDPYHWQSDGVRLQGEIICEHIRKAL